MKKIVLIGCGKIATLTHMPALDALRQKGLIDIGGVCDTDTEKAKSLAEKFQVPFHGADWREVVTQSGAEAVSVCLPPGANAEVSIQAVEMGLHVICEKPPGRTYEQAERMASAARDKQDLVTMVAFNRRFAPLYVKAMDHSLRLGQPNVLYGRFTRGGMGTRPSNTAADWITSDGSHVLDLAIATMGLPHSLGVSRKAVGGDLENVWSIQLHTDGGSAILLFDFAAGRRVERFEWAGPGYDVVLELPEKGEWCGQGGPVQHWAVGDVSRTEEFFVNYGWLGEYEAFAAAIRGDGPRPSVDFQYAQDFMRVVQMILGCPSGEMRNLSHPRPEGGEEAALKPAPEVKVRSVGRNKAVVQVLQAPAAQARYFNGEQQSQLGKLCDLRMRTDEEWRKYLPEADVLVTGWGGVPLTPDDIALAEKLKMVVVVGASVKLVSPELLLERGIVVCNTADAIAQSVAEHCLLLSLAGLRRLTEVNGQMHDGLWPPQSTQTSLLSLLINHARKIPGIGIIKPVARPAAKKILSRSKQQKPAGWSDLQGQTVGLVGWGHIARHFVRLLRPFNVKLQVCSEHITESELASLNAKRASLGEVFGGSKIVSIHKGVSDRSRGMFGQHELSVLPAGVVLVNTARAELFDEDALVARLKRGDIVAGLDVFHHEPLSTDHPLRKLPNVILSPHNAGSTPQCQQRVGRQALEIVADYLSGKPVPAIDERRLVNMT